MITFDIYDVTAFRKLTNDQYDTLANGWVSNISLGEIAEELGLSVPMVRAYYGIRDLMYFQENGSWLSV